MEYTLYCLLPSLLDETNILAYMMSKPPINLSYQLSVIYVRNYIYIITQFIPSIIPVHVNITVTIIMILSVVMMKQIEYCTEKAGHALSNLFIGKLSTKWRTLIIG